MLESSIFSGFDETLKSISGGKLNYETKLSSAGLIFWFYGHQVIAKILQLDSNKVDFFYQFKTLFSIEKNSCDELNRSVNGILCCYTEKINGQCFFPSPMLSLNTKVY